MKQGKYLMFGVVLTLFLSVFFVSCLDDDDDYNDDILKFIYEPILVESMNSSIAMKTQYGDILAPQLNQAKPGEYYLTNFMMDTTNRPYTAYNLEYLKMGADTLSISTALSPSTEYNAYISDLEVYMQDPEANSLLKLSVLSPTLSICIDSTFFVMAVLGNQDQRYELEMFTLSDALVTPGVVPTFYIRAKTTNAEISKRAYALNFSTWPKSTTTEGPTPFAINLKYKTGVDASGNEIYADYKKNPVKLMIKK